MALIVPVVNLAAGVVVARLVERVDLPEVIADRGDMVSYNVYHHPNALGVGGSNEALKFVSGSEVGINGFPVLGPVSVITTG